MVEGQQPLVSQHGEELDGEEWIAATLRIHQLRQGLCVLWRTAQAVGDELAHILARERRQHDLLNSSAGAADGREALHERVRGGELVVAVGADQQEIAQVRPGRQVLEQVERGRVQPLQVVEEQRQRMLRAREDGEQAVEHELEAPLRIRGRQLRHRRLRAEKELELRDQRHHERPVAAQCLAKRLAPARQLGVALAQQRADQALQGLRQCRVGNVALVLIELAGREQPPHRHQHFVQLVHYGRFADARVAGDEHQLGGAGLQHALEGFQQGVDLALFAVQLLRNQQLLRRVVRAQGEILDAVQALPVIQAALQVALQAGGGLIALLRRLGEQLHDDRR
jgi:hypothetical protein